MDGDGPTQKRKRTFRQESTKKAKLDNGSAQLKSGFGAKMLAKMGYTGEGGLGRAGEGISEPIQVVMRGTRGGVGIVAEKSEQQRREERKRAEANGEEYYDTSGGEEEEGRAPNNNNNKRKNKANSQPDARNAAPRPTKTVFDMEAAGIHVPQALQSIIDSTTGASTPTSSLCLRGTDFVPFENSLQARVRRDLNGFSQAFEGLQLESETIAPRDWALDKELKMLEQQMEETRDIIARLQSMRAAPFADVCSQLKQLAAAHPSKPFHRESIAIISPHFSQFMAGWAPLDNALEQVALAFSELSHVIQPQSRQFTTEAHSHPSDALAMRTATDEQDKIKRGTTSSYETMMLTLWLPTVSSAVTRWDVENPRPLIHLIETWSSVLPPFVKNRVLDQITHKLRASIQDWNPKIFKKSPHTWVVQWLLHLKPDDLDPIGSGLLAEVKRKLRHALQSIDISRGPLPGMDRWRSVFGKAEFNRLLTTHLVPRLATHLRDHFQVNPAEQDLAPLEAVFAWRRLLPLKVLGELLRAQFFPKALDIVHQWLSNETADLGEVSAWLEWWQNDIFGPELSALPSVSACWEEVFLYVNKALDMGMARLTDLPAPNMESVLAAPETLPSSKSVNKEPPRAPAPVEEITFRQLTEEFCAEENLLMVPLREAHAQTGHALFRITASATGRGGAVVYFEGDTLRVQNKKDKSVWEPVGLGGALIARAELK